MIGGMGERWTAVNPLVVAAIAYLVASGATRAEAQRVVSRLATQQVPLTVPATLDQLDVGLAELRGETS